MRSSLPELLARVMHRWRHERCDVRRAAPVLMTPLVALMTNHPAHAWLVRPELGVAATVQATAGGDVITGGASVATDAQAFTVRRQRGIDGTDVWNYELDGSAPDVPGSRNDLVTGVLVDTAGDVIAGGVTRNSGTALDVQIVKLAGNDGQLKWSQALDSPIHGNDELTMIALHPTGDLVVAASMARTTDFPQEWFSTVARVAGTDGTIIWQHDVGGQARAVAASVHCDSSGNVLVTGASESMTGESESDVLALKLDGATGAELWRTVMDGGVSGSDASYTGAVDAAGDLYLGGRTAPLSGGPFTVYKLSGATGALLWRADATTSSPYSSSWVGVIATDDATASVYAVGPVDSHYELFKLSAATGASVWSRQFRRDLWSGLALDAAGNVILNGARRYRFGFAKISAADGRPLWRRSVGPANSYNGGWANGAALDAGGNLLLAGKTVAPPLPDGRVNGPPSYTVVKACGANGRITRTDVCP